MKKSELKALIKECLIEILSDGISRPRSPERFQTESSALAVRTRPSLPDSIPPAMKSLFMDSQQRITQQSQLENVQVEKQSEFLEGMSKTWENMAYAAPLPSRAMDPLAHNKGAARGAFPGPSLPNDFNEEQSFDDFDPYEAVKAARRR